MSILRALVLGGTGMLGHRLVREGRRRGHPCLGLSRAQADVTDPERLGWWVRSFRPAVVFNCAAMTAVDACETEPDRAFAVNAEGAGNAAAAAVAGGARIIHLSTDYVFAGDADEPYPEVPPDDPSVVPPSVYGASKREGEERVLERRGTTVVRTSWLFGPPGGSGGGNFVATMLRLVAAGTDPLRVVDDQMGCPTYAPYLARALWELAERGDTAGVLHYRNRGPVSWYGFAREIVRSRHPEVGVEPVTTEEVPRPAPRPAYSVLGVDRFERLTGRSVEPWSAGLQQYLDLMEETGSRGPTQGESPRRMR